MLVQAAAAALAIAASVTAQAVVPPFTAPAAAPTAASSFYTGANNGTLVNGPVVAGKAFDRIITIWLENTNFAVAASNAYLSSLASQGILLDNYHAVTHPSEPNYMSVVGGDYWGCIDDAFHELGQNVSTVVDLLEAKKISWAVYQENMPTDGFTGFNYSNPTDNYTYYVRKHNPVIFYDSVALNPTRASRIRNFNDFAADVNANVIPQWSFFTPNMKNDGHDTNINWVGNYTQYFLGSLLTNPNFNDNRTLILLTFDENEVYPSDNNRVFAVLLGGAVTSSGMAGTVDSTFYTHYSTLSTVQNNWGLGSLGRHDTVPTLANVFNFVASQTGYSNINVTTQPSLNSSASYTGPFNVNYWTPVLAPNVSAVGAGGGPVFVDPSVNLNLTSATPVNLTALAAAASGASANKTAIIAGSVSAVVVVICAIAFVVWGRPSLKRRAEALKKRAQK
ncbi:hypothetical protein SmJEL517_g02448 [Synchytrium microbalum]|uniref:Acid phosphatase n=1 Tax=Synchytrium microbalum TaxID=1806994 RepID=A0A507C7A8_9FUNG|nr:uncharacterized protein SmJEL517_g02448 [Synchytrium microbalum]TPX35019.1 hypothetical protein SmJEL517_g02448 [Synchytrium microbalum]